MSRGRFVLAVLVLLALATGLCGQQTAPTDAKEFLAQHALFESSSKSTRADEAATLENARFYLHAGAENELRKEIAKLSEDHPVALRYAMLADCWNPSTYEQGLTRSKTWLRNFPERPRAEQQSVTSVHDFLAAKDVRREVLMERRAATAWLPFLSILVVMALVAGGLRRWP